MTTISIEGLDKAEILAVLYNNAVPMGMGFLQANDAAWTREDAQRVIDGGSPDYPGRAASLYFDYVYGRPLKVNLAGNEMRTDLYDRDQGEGKAARCIEQLRNGGGVGVLDSSERKAKYAEADRYAKTMDRTITISSYAPQD